MLIGIFPTNVYDFLDNCSLDIYPNPSNGIFNIELSCATLGVNYDVEIYDLIGKQVRVYQGLNQSNNIETVDLSLMPNGVYIIYLKNENGIILHPEKIIIQK
jgi:hypothetical protein